MVEHVGELSLPTMIIKYLLPDVAFVFFFIMFCKQRWPYRFQSWAAGTSTAILDKNEMVIEALANASHALFLSSCTQVHNDLPNICLLIYPSTRLTLPLGKVKQMLQMAGFEKAGSGSKVQKDRSDQHSITPRYFSHSCTPCTMVKYCADCIIQEDGQYLLFCIWRSNLSSILVGCSWRLPPFLFLVSACTCFKCFLHFLGFYYPICGSFVLCLELLQMTYFGAFILICLHEAYVEVHLYLVFTEYLFWLFYRMVIRQGTFVLNLSWLACGVFICLPISHSFVPLFPVYFIITFWSTKSLILFLKWICCAMVTESFNPL